MSSLYVFPKPKHDDTFEDIVRDIFIKLFNNPNIQKYGRKGQSQGGIDVIGFAGYDYTKSELVGIQCKNHTVNISANKLIAELESDLEKYDKSALDINKFIFVTSADNSDEVKKYI